MLIQSDTKRETNLWRDLLNGEAESLRIKCEEIYTQLFSDDYSESLRSFISMLLAGDELIKNFSLTPHHHCSDLTRLHPEAIHLLLEYGKDYAPKAWKNLPPEPQAKNCHANTWYLVKRRHQRDESKKLCYVEGVAVGSLVRPMIHAWATPTEASPDFGLAIDWTFFSSSQWNKYFGIPFTHDEYRRLTKFAHPDINCSFLLLTKDNFPLVISCLIEILSNRKNDNGRHLVES